MLSRGLIAPETDSDLRKTNEWFAGRSLASRDGMAPPSWSDVPHAFTVYLLTVVVCSGASLLAFWLGWGV